MRFTLLKQRVVLQVGPFQRARVAAMHCEAPRRIGFAPMLSHSFLRAQAGRGAPTPLIGIRPGNCISPREGGRDTLLVCATSLPTPPRPPARRPFRRAVPVYPRAEPDPSRARCHPAGVSSSIGVKSLSPGRVAR
jgi:hypothetical protein